MNKKLKINQRYLIVNFLVTFCCICSGAMTKTGSDGRVIPYPFGWMTKTGSDGRVVPYPLGWMTKTGSDGRVIAYPLGWMTKTGSDGRVVPYHLSNNSDLRYEIIAKAGNAVDGLSVLKMMGYIDSESRSFNSGNNRSEYDLGYLKATQDVQALLVSEYGVTNLKDLNDAALLYGANSGKNSVTSDPSAYNLVTKTSFDQALLDANASAEQAIADAKVLAKAEGLDEGKSLGVFEGETTVTSNPYTYNLVTQSAYDEMMNELMSASDSNSTPYSEGWFYLPNRGWMFTNRTSYPYFYDSTSKAWMYFQSGNNMPRFYHYGTKEWMTLE